MFINLISHRRSIRRFENRPVEKEKVDLLIEAALLSPSSRSLDPWEFVVVDDQRLMERMATAKPHGAAFLKNAPLAVVVCADPGKCDVWVEDASVATTFLHLAAESIGLGSCWIQIRKRMRDEEKSAEKHISELLDLPDRLRVLSIVAVGYPAERKPPHDRTRLQYDKVHFNRYGEKRLSPESGNGG